MSEVSVSPADLAKMIADGVAAAMEANKATKSRKGTKTAKGGNRKPMTDEEKAARRSAADVETVQKFTAAGYKDVRPRENVLVYGRLKDDGTVGGWLGRGRRVKKGEKAIKVGSFPLFHVDQTELVETKH